MDEHSEIALIITVCVIPGILILLFIVWKCCYKDGKFMSPSQKRQETLQGRLLPPGSKKSEFLVKRCDQQSTRKVEDRIIKKLRGNCYVVDRPWDQALDDGGRPVIVFCVISSRIGTDIENAMRGVNGKSLVVLVLLHCHLKSLLQNRDLSDDHQLLDVSMRNRMEGIADFAFSDREGLYSCPQNEEGHRKLASIVKSLMK